MSKIYIVLTGEYSDCYPRGVYSTEEKAKEAEKYYYGDIEEFELDVLPKYPEGLLYYSVGMQKTGNIDPCRCDAEESIVVGGYMNSGLGFFDKGPEVYRLHVWAKDKQHAAKIANEKRTQMIATGKWDKLTNEAIEKDKKLWKVMKDK